MLKLLEVADTARILGLSGAAVKVAADRGDLPIAAMTPRGVRLFSRVDVEEYRAAMLRAGRRRTSAA